MAFRALSFGIQYTGLSKSTDRQTDRHIEVETETERHTERQTQRLTLIHTHTDRLKEEER